jgi:N utilization substance protein A
VKTLDDLADLAGDELVEIAQGAGIKLEAEEANAIIMKARAHWFPEEEKPAEDEAAPAEPKAE